MRYVSRTKLTKVALLATIIGLVSGCSGGTSYASRMAYLEKMAKEGVQTHHLLTIQGVHTTAKRCTTDYNALADHNPPSDQPWYDGPSTAWLDQIQAFFVQSCATGMPKPISGQ